ncbi:hypothetical protein Tco_1544701 [Tanacetum coccineum]
MSSDNASSAVTYTSISSDSDGPSWGIPLMNADELPKMDPHEEEEDLKEDSEEDPIDYAADTDDDDEEEEPSDDDEEEEYLAPAVALSTVDHVPSAEETKPFETDKSAATPPSPLAYRTTSRMSV